MGSCVSLNLKKSDAGNLIRPLIKPPTVTKTINLSEMNQILYKATKCDNMIFWDDQYDLISEDEIKRFLYSNINETYVEGGAYDCDDFSFSVLARAREWAYNRVNRRGGLGIGVLAGDLRLNEADPYRGHAVAFFITPAGQVKLLDGMYNQILDIKPWMDIKQLII